MHRSNASVKCALFAFEMVLKKPKLTTSEVPEPLIVHEVALKRSYTAILKFGNESS